MQPIAVKPFPTAAPAAVPAPAPEASAARVTDTVSVNYTPQDPSTIVPGLTVVPRADIGAHLEGRRLKMDDGTPASPDADGNYHFAAGTAGFQQANSFACADKTLRMFEAAVGHPIDWAFDQPLKIKPHFGDGFNAFYLRLDKSVHFYDGKDDKIGAVFHGSESLDVVSHEVGHAVLDGMQPGLVGWFGGKEAPAFHESFGDIAAMLTAMRDDRVIDRLLAETDGDLHRDNIVAHLGEELSRGINDSMLHGAKPDGWTIRNANNDFKYQDPKTLPKSTGDPDGLSNEPHSFSRIYTGACWDILAGMAESFKADGMSSREAIVAARDVFTSLYAHAVEMGPNRLKRYRQEADAMLAADAHYGGAKFSRLLADVFSKRGIRPTDASAELLPSVRMPSSLLTPADADAFVNRSRGALGIPAEVPLRAEKVWRNERGETFVRWGWTEEMVVDPQTTTDLQGTLTLGFDGQGRLFHFLYEPIDDEERSMARENIAEMQRRGAIRPLGGDAAGVDARYGAYVTMRDGRRRLVKIPGVWD